KNPPHRRQMSVEGVMISSQSQSRENRGVVIARRAMLGLALLGGALLLVTSAWSQPAPENAPKKMSVEEWRKQYPFTSLGDRLEYEAKRPRGETPTLTDETKKRLDE